MTDTTIFVGLDVHKETIAVAMAPASPGAAFSYYGAIANTTEALRKLCKKLSAGGETLEFCYEAGPCGYVVQRRLSRWGYRCDVVAPNLIPRKASDRIKNDRRDAITLAKNLRSDQLTAVWVPDEAHEAMRELIRLRSLAMRDQRRSRQQLLSFLLRHGLSYPGTHWSKAHRGWLSDLSFPQPAQHLVLEELLQRIERAESLCARLADAIADLLPSWTLAPVVEALQALRGVSMLNAATLVAEIGSFNRFDNPRQLMGYLGLVPSEHSSGRTVRRGPITKTGNSLARTSLIEAAWTYRFPARVSRIIHKRSAHLPEPIRVIAWKAQIRLTRRYRHLIAAGKAACKTVTAIARELVGFVWAIARMVEPKTA
ncbi:MAG: IS110 family transposase [Alphaproteobacteria bacterium]|nr:IS110 family transposase [Alphaproteobacteria bacterium]